MRVLSPLVCMVLWVGGCCDGLASGVSGEEIIEAVTEAPVEEPVTEEELGRPPMRLGKAGGRGGEQFFARMDKDSDGKLSTDEFRGSDERFVEVDTNGDGFIDAEESAASRPNRFSRRGDFMGRHDGDGDGRISAEEYLGKETRFQKLDVNQDGFIDDMEAPGGRRARDEVDGEDEPTEAADTDPDEASQP